MSKELPYFKFTVADWLTGDIVYEQLNIQGLFVNICAIYWQRKGKLSIDDINKRFKNPVELSELTDRFISVSDGFISIKFLDEQFEERKSLSFVNSKNGKKGGRPKVLIPLEEKPTANQTLSEPKPKKSNIEKKRKEKKRKEDTSLDLFDSFRKLYPGIKLGNETEFKNFTKKHSDWKEVLPILFVTIQRQVINRQEKINRGDFAPEWKNLQTWINQRCWEEEIPVLNKPEETLQQRALRLQGK